MAFQVELKAFASTFGHDGAGIQIEEKSIGIDICLSRSAHQRQEQTLFGSHAGDRHGPSPSASP